MKNAMFFSYLLVIISTSIITGCGKESIDYTDTPKEIISSGFWSVEYYFSGQDKTSQFNNYQFHFNDNGDLTATEGTNSINGSWSMVTDVNRNQVLRINIQEAHLSDLNEQWNVTATASNMIDMKGTSSEMRLKKL
jgi:hypothetical protein